MKCGTCVPPLKIGVSRPNPKVRLTGRSAPLQTGRLFSWLFDWKVFTMVDLIVGIAAASQGVCRTLRSLQFLRPGRTWNLKTTGLYRGKLSFRVPFSVHIRVFGSVPQCHQFHGGQSAIHGGCRRGAHIHGARWDEPHHPTGVPGL